jgi:hypothetical protein
MFSHSGRSINKQFVCFNDPKQLGDPIESISQHDSKLYQAMKEKK